MRLALAGGRGCRDGRFGMQLTALYGLVLTLSGAAALGITIVFAFGLRATSVQSVTGAVRSNQFARDFIAIIVGGGIALATSESPPCGWPGWSRGAC